MQSIEVKSRAAEDQYAGQYLGPKNAIGNCCERDHTIHSGDPISPEVEIIFCFARVPLIHPSILERAEKWSIQKINFEKEENLRLPKQML
jgi:hypothetical protein